MAVKSSQILENIWTVELFDHICSSRVVGICTRMSSTLVLDNSLDLDSYQPMISNDSHIGQVSDVWTFCSGVSSSLLLPFALLYKYELIFVAPKCFWLGLLSTWQWDGDIHRTSDRCQVSEHCVSSSLLPPPAGHFLWWTASNYETGGETKEGICDAIFDPTFFDTIFQFLGTIFFDTIFQHFGSLGAFGV